MRWNIENTLLATRAKCVRDKKKILVVGVCQCISRFTSQSHGAGKSIEVP